MRDRKRLPRRIAAASSAESLICFRGERDQGRELGNGSEDEALGDRRGDDEAGVTGFAEDRPGFLSQETFRGSRERQARDADAAQERVHVGVRAFAPDDGTGFVEQQPDARGAAAQASEGDQQQASRRARGPDQKRRLGE